MMRSISLYVLAPLAVALGLGVHPARAAGGSTDPSSSVEGFICTIDVSVLGTTLPGGGTETSADSSDLHCTGSLANENIQLTCLKQLQEWTGGAVQARDFECVIQGGACGVSAPSGDPNAPGLSATSSALKIGSGGAVQLQCTWDASKSPYAQ